MSVREVLEATRTRWLARERQSRIEDERCALDLAQRCALLCADRRCMPRLEAPARQARAEDLLVVIPPGPIDRESPIVMLAGPLIIATGPGCGTMERAVELAKLAASTSLVSPGWSLHFIGLILELLGGEDNGYEETSLR